MSNSKVKFSIVLCTFNGAEKIEKSLQSLLNQNFPKENYEIVVVDDGSTDNTVDVVNNYPVKLIKLDKNSGLATARNKGLEVAKGDIYVCYDDDCTADINWLSELDKAFYDKSVIGAGGLVQLSNTPTITDEYCFSCGYPNPVPLTLGRSKSIFVRFWDYLVTNISNPQEKFVNGTKVLELPGALSAFRIKLLKEIGGWDTMLVNASEDTDLCRRLRNKFKKMYFVAMPSSKVVHEQKIGWVGFIKKEFMRGKVRKQFYKLKGETPPYFPFPFLFLMISFLVLYLRYDPLVLLFLPIIIYPWWIVRSIKEKSIKLLLFSYMQLMHESATVLGMIFSK
jgi:glycosyltransferase involved in cell wall biosynthesis